MAKRTRPPPQKSAGTNRSSSSANKEPSSAKQFGPVLAAVVLTFLVTRLPQQPVSTVLDAAWGYVLNFAHQKGLQFGPDIAYTYGPLGFMEQEWFAGKGEGVRLIFAFLRGFVISYGVCLLAWRMSIPWRCLFLGVFIVLPGSVHAARVEPLMEVGLFFWALLNLLEYERPNYIPACGLIALAAFGSLGKFTFLMLAAMTLFLVPLDFALRGRFKMALCLVVIYLGAFLVGWLLLDQHFSSLVPYFKSSLPASLDYDEAMSWKTPANILMPGLFLMAFALITMFIYCAKAYAGDARWRRLRCVFLFALAAGFTFLFWKHGYVRHKMDLFAAAVPALALSLDVLPFESKTFRLCARAGAIACCVTGCFLLVVLTPGYFGDVAARDFNLLSGNLSALVNPFGYLNRMTKALNAERDAAQLPVIRKLAGQSTADVFGQYQSYALFNDLNYHPRPDFQSYATCDTALAKLNEDFYNSTNAPRFVLFNLEPIDGRFPALEDSHVLRDLLLNYTPVEREGKFLLLKRQQSLPPQMSLLKEGAASIGEPVNLNSYGDADLWMEISIRPTLLGRLRKILFKPPEIVLQISGKQTASKPALFRAATPMLAAGFLVSPIILRDADVVDLYTGEKTLRPGSCMVIASDNTENFWQKEFDYKIYKIESKLGRSVPSEMSRLKFPGFQVAPQINAQPGAVGMATIGGNPALVVFPGSSLVFSVPAGATNVTGNFGFPEAAFLQGTTAGAEFRVEETASDGTSNLLFHQILSPRSRAQDRGFKHFSVPLSAKPGETITLRSVSQSPADTRSDLTSWAEIRFN